MRVADVRAILARCEGVALAEAIDSFADDVRPGVVAACSAARRRLALAECEDTRQRQLEALEQTLREQGYRLIAGVDEVGRGALAGPVSAAACILPAGCIIRGLDDSKRLTPARREELAAVIVNRALDVGIAHVGAGEIDALGIARATAEAMRRALRGLEPAADHVVIDGLPMDIGFTHTAVVKGDRTVRAIAAASVVAKVARDALMVELDCSHPGYGFAANKGYGSPEHLEAIELLGPCAVHRLSFAPCSQRTLF